MADKEPAKIESAITLSGDAQIRDMIYTVRGQQVMLDSNLAELYEVETKRLNRATKRNEDRFPRGLPLQAHKRGSGQSKVPNWHLSRSGH